MKSDSEFAKHILNVIKNKLNGKENATSTKPMT